VAPEAALAIAKLCAGFSPDAALTSGVSRDGMVVPELIRQLRATLPESHRDALHLRSTSQHAIDTALILRLAMRTYRSVEGGGTSSAMHHKSNPVAAELLVAVARYVAGQAGCFHQVLVHEQE